MMAMLLWTGTSLVGQDQEKPQGANARDMLAQALKEARAEKKQVFLVFGSPACVWCDRLQQYHDKKEVSAILKKHFVFLKVDIFKNPGGKELYERFGEERGVPAFTVLDAEDKKIVDSADGGDNLGYPYEPEEIEQYFKLLRKCCPTLTEKEIEVLRSKLKEVAAKKKE